MVNRSQACGLMLAACLAGAIAAGEEPSEPERPAPASVLLVTLDTTRADRLGCYGAKDAATPVLDRLATEGVRFDQALAPTPLTLPSHQLPRGSCLLLVVLLCEELPEVVPEEPVRPLPVMSPDDGRGR